MPRCNEKISCGGGQIEKRAPYMRFVKSAYEHTQMPATATRCLSRETAQDRGKLHPGDRANENGSTFFANSSQHGHRMCKMQLDTHQKTF